MFFLKKRAPSISFSEDQGNSLMIIGGTLVTFIILMTLVGSFILSSWSNKWSMQVTNNITIEIPAPLTQTNSIPVVNKKLQEEQNLEILDVLGKHPGIDQISPLGTEETLALIKPWIDEDISIDIVPIPTIIDLRLNKERNLNLETLKSSLQKINPEAQINDNTEWLSETLYIINTINQAIFLIMGTIFILSILALTGFIKNKLSSHHTEIDLLHALGASDSYISQQFYKHSLSITLKCILMGTIIALTFLLITAKFPDIIFIPLLSSFNPSLTQWIILACLPFTLGYALTALVTKLTTYKALRYLP